MKKVVLLAIFSIGLLFSSEYSKQIKPVDNKLYQKECASCHFGYQPSLLPKKSWVKLMNNLENHFGDDASLDEQDRKILTQYLVKNASDTINNRSKYRYKNQNKKVITRITQMPYFVKEHNEIPKRLIKQKEVGSLSNCASCHKTAKKGYYGERGIYIPNYGRWD